MARRELTASFHPGLVLPYFHSIVSQNVRAICTGTVFPEEPTRISSEREAKKGG